MGAIGIGLLVCGLVRLPFAFVPPTRLGIEWFPITAAFQLAVAATELAGAYLLLNSAP